VILDTASGKILHTLKGHEGTVSCVGLTPDGTRAVTGGFKDHRVFVWDLDRGLILHRMRHEGRVYAVQMLPDGARAVTSSYDDGTIRIWDLKTGRELRRMPPPYEEGGANLACSADGRLLVAGWHDWIWLWDLVAMQVVARIPAPNHRVYGPAFAPDSRRIVTTGWDDHTVRVWRLPPVAEPPVVEEEEFLFPSRADLLWSVILSPDRRLLAVPGAGGLTVWDLERRTRTLQISSATVVWPCIGAFTPDRRFLVMVGGDRAVRLWDLATGEPPRSLGMQEQVGSSVAVSPDGQLAATSAQAGADPDRSLIHLWSLERGTELGQLQGRFGATGQMSFSRDGTHLIASHARAQLVMWDLERGEPDWKLDGEGGRLAPMPDGRHALVSSESGDVRLIDLKTGAIVREFKGHTRPTVLVEPSPDGRFLLTTAYESPDSSVRIWDLATGRQLVSLDVPGHPGTGGWLRDSRHFLFGDLMGAIHIYRISDEVVGSVTKDNLTAKTRAKDKAQRRMNRSAPRRSPSGT
jgi:WD40 repeat protein